MLSLHIIADNAPPERLDRAVEYLRNTKQPYVNIGGGSQVDRAMQLVEWVQIEVPGIQVFWRVLQDTGNIFAMTAPQWWQERIAPRLKWMQEHNVIMVVDNETSGDDAIIKRYVEQSLIRMAMLHDNGLYGAFCRFATGNIVESQYALLKPLLNKLWPKDWISPNEYSNLPGKSSGGHLERWKRIRAVTTNKLQFAMGECGILNDYRANDGYTSYISGVAMAKQLLSEEDPWYEGGTIPRFMFVIGGYDEWRSLQIGDDALDYLERHYAAHPIQPPRPPVPIPPPVPVPTPDTIRVSRKELQSIQAAMQTQLDAIGDIIKKS